MPYPSSADTDAMVARVALAILELLGDGVSRSRRAIIAELAGRHDKQDVALTLMRLCGRARDWMNVTTPTIRPATTFPSWSCA